MTNELHDFKNIMKQREEPSQVFVNGDIGPLDRIAIHVSPATIFGPQGDYGEGADEVNAANMSGAKHFESGSKSRFEVLQMAASGGVA